jgi:CheY-like chemotaxis protein
MVSSVDILKAQILVVDDKHANVSLMEGMLRVAGYTSVHSTTDPKQVCELHRRNRYGLILLDLQMPVIDGFQVMEGLKEIEADGYLPVLVMTAQPDQKLRALEAGAKDFVSKPFDMAETPRACSQYSGSAPPTSRIEELRQSAGGDGTGTGSKPRGHPSQKPGGA